MTIKFDNSFARLPEEFFSRQLPTPVSAPKLLQLNEPLAQQLGLDITWLKSSQGVEMLAGNHVPPGADPLAAIYGGHQFGHWSGQLGDGRAILLGEVVDSAGKHLDLQLKGAGRTPYSRGGDGRAALGPVLREYLLSEAMHALGIPTTRALAMVTTGEAVQREQPLQGAILTRVATSHIRVGSFQIFLAQGNTQALRALADFVITRHYPDLAKADNPYLELLSAVITRQAKLVARWMGIGFIHGVMNTDNMTVSGETIDYGPCAFMDDFHPSRVFSSIDRNGRYAYGNQPSMAHWNLSQLARCLLPLIDEDETQAMHQGQARLDLFSDIFSEAYYDVFSQKIGLKNAGDDTKKLVDDLLALMAEHAIDFTLFFTALSCQLKADSQDNCRALFTDPAPIDAWLQRWQALLPQDLDDVITKMRAANPCYIPRNHQVEAAIAAAEQGDLSVFERLQTVLATPFVERAAYSEFEAAPKPDQPAYQTFCGT